MTSIMTKTQNSRTGFYTPARQQGATLMETLIALTLSMLVVISMVALMGNTVNTSSRITQMTQLTDELRNVMSMMTRDVRRANYSSTAVLCYGNPNCGDHDWSRQMGSGTAIGDLTANGECLLFQLDRLDNLDGDATNDPKGGFRRIVQNGVGVIQMWVNEAATAPGCGDAADAAGWLAVTDPNIVNITALTIDAGLNTELSILQDSGTTSYTQRQRQLRLAVEGELVLEDRLGWNPTDNPVMVRREIEDVIKVRNDFLIPPTPVS